MKFLALFLLLNTHSYATTNLLLIGGGKRPVEAMREFVQLAGGSKADILIIPWASESLEGAEAIKAELTLSSPGKLQIVPHRIASAEDLSKLTNHFERCSGVFFTGGNQNVLMTLIKEYKLLEIFRRRFQAGVIFGGTSAGTAIMSNPMLTGSGDLSVINGSQVELTEGLGLLPPNVIVDQHFIVRQRFNRLAGLVLKNGAVGIGVDEGTAVLIKSLEGKVIGPTQVLLFEKKDHNKLDVTVVPPGDSFILSQKN